MRSSKAANLFLEESDEESSSVEFMEESAEIGGTITKNAGESEDESKDGQDRSIEQVVGHGLLPKVLTAIQRFYAVFRNKEDDETLRAGLNDNEIRQLNDVLVNQQLVTRVERKRKNDLRRSSPDMIMSARRSVRVQDQTGPTSSPELKKKKIEKKQQTGKKQEIGKTQKIGRKTK